MRFFLLYLATAAAEIFGCYSVYLDERSGGFCRAPSLWQRLLSLHPNASGLRPTADSTSRASIDWLWLVDGVRPDRWDMLGSGICHLRASFIFFAPRS